MLYNLQVRFIFFSYETLMLFNFRIWFHRSTLRSSSTFTVDIEMFRIKKKNRNTGYTNPPLCLQKQVPAYVHIPESTQTYARAANNKIYISTFGMFERSTNDLKKDIAEAPVAKKELS